MNVDYQYRATYYDIMNNNEWIEMIIGTNRAKDKYFIKFSWNSDGFKKGEKIIEMEKHDLDLYHFYPAIASCCPCNMKLNDKGYGFEFCTMSNQRIQ